MGKTSTSQYTAAVDALRTDIARGVYAPGDWLPSEAAIMARYHVSRYSAREALKRLAAEGLIVTVDGKGSHVKTRHDRATYSGLRSLRRTSSDTGTVHYVDTELENWSPVDQPRRYRATATLDLALSLGVPEHTPLFVYHRLLHHHSTTETTPDNRDGNGQRMIHRLYLPAATCTDIPALADDPFRDPGELYALLTQAGQTLHWVEHVRATTPTPEDTTTLHIPPGLPVLITRRITTNTHTRPLAMEETRRNADNTQLSYPQTPTTD